MNYAAINSVISMYHTLIYMLAAVWLVMKSESFIKITKALARTHQKPGTTSFICEDVLLVQSRGTNSKPRIKKKEKNKWEYWQEFCGFLYCHLGLSQFTQVRSLSVEFHDRYQWKSEA